MLGGLPVGIGDNPRGGEEIVHEARPPVGVLHRINDDDGFGHDLRRLRVALDGEQVIGGHQRGIGRGDFVAVDPVGEPRNRQRGAIAGAARGDGGHIGADRFELCHVGGGGEHQIVERPALPAGRILHQPGAVRRGVGEGLQVGIGLIRRGDPRARCMPDGGGQRRDRGIEVALREGLRRSGRGDAGHGKQQKAPTAAQTPDCVTHRQSPFGGKNSRGTALP